MSWEVFHSHVAYIYLFIFTYLLIDTYCSTLGATAGVQADKAYSQNFTTNRPSHMAKKGGKNNKEKKSAPKSLNKSTKKKYANTSDFYCNRT